MTEAIFSEKRTRSQLTLPDNILHIPDRSPLKDARTALRNHTVTTDTCSPSKRDSDDTDDELLLSPGKNETHMKANGNSKRSASPPPNDEYFSPRSGSPSEGRELKRAKREGMRSEGNESDAENLKGIHAFQQRAVPGHARTHSDPNATTIRRSGRKRSATTSKKPISTVSASPTPTTFSPIAVSPRKDRARSVPLFSTGFDIPRIDFTNLPPSPKRSRSPSRSPSRDREHKLGLTSASFLVPPKLPTIRDELTNSMDLDEATSVDEEVEMPSVPETPMPQPIVTMKEPTPPTPPTPFALTILPKVPQVPATPASQSLNKLIPMSPLTPLPETPFPPRFTSNGGAEDRYSGNIGWGLPPAESKAASSQTCVPPPAATIRPSTSNSRLPRLSMAPPAAPPSKPKQAGPTGPSALATTSKKPTAPTQNSTAMPKKNSSSAPMKDAFALLMKKPREQQEKLEREKAKLKLNVTKSMPPPNIFASTSKGKEPVAGPSAQQKVRMKDKMRPKVKSSKPEQAPLLVPLPDEEDEEDRPMPSHTSESEPEPHMAEPSLPRTSPIPVERPLATPEDSAMDTELDEPSAEPTVGDASMADLQPHSEEDTIITENTTSVEVVDEEASVPPESSPIPADDDLGASEDHSAPAEDLPVSAEDHPVPVEEHSIPAEGLVVEDEVMKEIPQPSEEITPDSAQSTADASKEEEAQPQPDPPAPKAGASKLPLGKKRQPISVAPASRVTRSASSSKKKGGETEVSTSGPSRTTTTKPTPVPAKRTISGAIKKPMIAAKPSQDASMDVAEPGDKIPLPPGSPMRLVSPAKTPKQNTPKKSPKKYSFSKPNSTPSPTKIARSSALHSLKPSSFRSTFSTDYQTNIGPSSSLSTLSNALEKLRMPAPSRPSTSMGFNRDAPSDGGSGPGVGRSQDDAALGRPSLGMSRPDGGLKRAATLGADAFKVPALPANAGASSSRASGSTGKSLVQKSLAMYMSNKGANAKTVTGTLYRGAGKAAVLGNKAAPLFGVGGGVRRTISKKSSLPMVVGSPVKGGGTVDETMQEGHEDENEDARTHVADETGDDVFTAQGGASSSTLLLEDLGTEASDKGKGKERETGNRPSYSRRVSMVSHALTQSLSAIPPPPPPPARGLMGPPATPPTAGRTANRSSSSNYPSTSAGGSSPSQAGPTLGTRFSARIAKTAPGVLMKIKGGTDGHVSSTRKGAAEPAPPPNPAAEALKVLKDCVIFADVRTDDGEEAGSLFVEMLEGVGARILTRVGQTCTHIVYKNGLMSTLSRYRLLRDPKPFVVGIAWVVECVEQRKRVDEADFLVDLEGANVAGVNKRRRSMLPRLFSSDLSLPSEPGGDDGADGDQSMDGSNTSITIDDDLAPLERARKRKSMMIGPRG
ncbi:hypothetical protein GALMADRAFT_248407 [Galerina marginata CBS 339.88]|uniref:BRCT domain-containing protein n=1 Tax=Galerina marginata (strain CBS 339.88) TaxID=685588 RepID=A0A067T732_GALM3|nr:hypothetical protein GALMADRAFT_248407 [Galerina marginata CBS 339.88]